MVVIQVRQFSYLSLFLFSLLLTACKGQPVQEVSPPVPNPEATLAVVESAAAADEDAPRPVALIPGQTRYVVKKGDSLWEIASRFLYDPWRWREVWQANPGLADPERIYPGDTLVLSLEGGRHRVSVTERALPIYKLSPQVREEPLPLESVPTVNKLVLDKFLVQARVVDKAEQADLPYVLGGVERRLLGGIAGEEIYVSGMKASDTVNYGIYKKVLPLRDGHGRHLGEQWILVAEARVVRHGSPALLRINRSTEAVKAGYRLFPLEARNEMLFEPRPAPAERYGRIISVFGGINMIGQYNSVSLDLGRRDGIEPGHVLGVYQQRQRYRDPLTGDWVEGQQRRAGILIVYKSYEQVSHALVMEAQRPLRVDDEVRRP